MKDQNGFTLIEIIVILVIIGIGMTAGIGGYITQVRMSQLKRDANRVVDDLDRARQLTMARDTKGVYCDTNSYSLEFIGATGNYNLRHTCGLTVSVETATKLESTQFVSNSTINFTEPYGAPAGVSTFLLKHPSLNKCIVFTVPVTGPVTISEPQGCF
ncbi:prepilin-type N-terminal cleavage/methylation domain-containing protein [Candidatus Woesebacteria bacterium]|nr:prepilin-type N-terminal cleavage/methylation domain-containing protein [Candidatus Woesebacteria bacterium]